MCENQETTIQLFKYWPGGCSQGSNPGLEDAQEEGEGVFPDDNKVDAGQEDCSVDDESDNHSHHIHAQLPCHHFQVFDGDDLTTDETGNTKWRVPVKMQKLLFKLMLKLSFNLAEIVTDFAVTL